MGQTRARLLVERYGIAEALRITEIERAHERESGTGKADYWRKVAAEVRRLGRQTAARP